MTNKISTLIERLEKATGPDRELDLSIHLAIDPDGKIAEIVRFRRGFDGCEGMTWDICGGSVCFQKYDDTGRCNFNGGYPLPRYTESIDAALTLVPDGWTISLHSDCIGKWFSEARKCGVGTHIAWPSRCTNGAIALCIPALKASEVDAP
jgi:hypothetical protein